MDKWVYKLRFFYEIYFEIFEMKVLFYMEIL